MKTRKYLVTFTHQGTILQRVVEATSHDNAMGCVCGFVLSCITIVE